MLFIYFFWGGRWGRNLLKGFWCFVFWIPFSVTSCNLRRSVQIFSSSRYRWNSCWEWSTQVGLEKIKILNMRFADVEAMNLETDSWGQYLTICCQIEWLYFFLEMLLWPFFFPHIYRDGILLVVCVFPYQNPDRFQKAGLDIFLRALGGCSTGCSGLALSPRAVWRVWMPSAEELEEVWMALRDASDDMMRVSGRDGPGKNEPKRSEFLYRHYHTRMSMYRYNIYVYLLCSFLWFIWFVWFIWSQNLLGVLILQILHACDGNERSEKTMTVNMAGVYKRVLLT